MTWLWVVAPVVLLAGGAWWFAQLLRLEFANRERAQRLEGIGRTMSAVNDLRRGIERLRRCDESLRVRGDRGHGEPAL